VELIPSWVQNYNAVIAGTAWICSSIRVKKSAIVIGKPNAGKSTTIRNFKKMVQMEGFHVFTLNGRLGYILSTSFEEAERDISATVRKRSGYDFLVLACQGPRLKRVHNALSAASFAIKDVNIETVRDAPKKAKEVFDFLN
jgi:hypothetical protein